MRENPDKQTVLDQFEKNPEIYWLAGEPHHGILTDAMESLQASGIEENEDGEVFVYLDDPEDEVASTFQEMHNAAIAQGRTYGDGHGVVPAIVGRDEWRIGLSLYGPGGAMALLTVLSHDESLLVRDAMKEAKDVIVFLRHQDKGFYVDFELETMQFLNNVGEEINRQEAAEKTGELDYMVSNQ